MHQFTKYDSEFCGSLPLHIINTVQEYGVLLVLQKDNREIVQVSENAEQIFRKPFKELIESNIADYINTEDLKSLLKYISVKPEEKISVTWTIHGKEYLTLIHVRETDVLLEIEIEPYKKSEQESFIAVYQDLKYTIDKIESATSLQEACSIIARELKRISGFNKVMVYTFDAEWNGTVLAEEMDKGMETYLGFTFPASDIPKPARDLYLKNPFRYIPDREFKPVKLYPVMNPLTSSFTDMSQCNLRGVTAVHVEYLKNMGVNASMSTRIIEDNKLWGLIACHHRTPRRMNYQMCSIFELLSAVISSKISSINRHDRNNRIQNVQQKYADLINSVYKSKNIVDGLIGDGIGVQQLLNASGTLLLYNGKVFTKGVIPPKSHLDDLLLWLQIKELKDIYYTETLPENFDDALNYKEAVSGLLVIPIKPSKDEYLMVFRTEVVKTINWGGNPDERINFEENNKIYHPRHSFKIWQEQVSGISHAWKPEEIQFAEKLRSFIYEFIRGDQ